MEFTKRVLIADDNEELCELLANLLTTAGFETEKVHTGYELLAYLKEKQPAIIILDLMMPGKSGVSVFDSIKSLSPSSRIIIYTGHEDYENSVYARKADKFILKDLNMDNLINAVKELA